MNEILQFVATRLSFLFEDNRFRIVHSESSNSMGNALVILESKTLRLRIARDRSQFLPDLQFLESESDRWYGLHTVRSRLGDVEPSGILDEKAVEFLRSSLVEAERLSATQALASNFESELEKIQQERAIDRWGPI